jgi:hypothetical protein
MSRRSRLESKRRELIREAGKILVFGDEDRAFSLLNTAMHFVNAESALSNSDVAECLSMMGNIKLKKDEAKEAESYLRLALFVYKRCGQDVTAKIRQVNSRLVIACRRQGQFSRSRELQRELGIVDDVLNSNMASLACHQVCNRLDVGNCSCSRCTGRFLPVPYQAPLSPAG